MKRIIYVCFFAVLLSSCTTSDNEQDPESNFYALTVGNEFEYRWYGVNNEGLEIPKDLYESITIVGTEEIDGNLYYKFNRIISGNLNGSYAHVPENGEHFEYYRDSLGFLINEEGLIKFSNSAYEEFQITAYEDGFGVIDGEFVGAVLYGKLLEDEVSFSTESGTFQCLKMTTRIKYDDGSEAPANNSIYYADGIGLISDDYVFVASEANAGYRRMLTDYNIQ